MYIGHHRIWRRGERCSLDLSVEFRDMPATGSGEAPNTPPSLPTTSNVEPKLLEVRGLPCFDPKEEPTTLSVRWKWRKRAFHLYVASKGVANQAQKVALLLHSGVSRWNCRKFSTCWHQVKTTLTIVNRP